MRGTEAHGCCGDGGQESTSGARNGECQEETQRRQPAGEAHQLPILGSKIFDQWSNSNVKSQRVVKFRNMLIVRSSYCTCTHNLQPHLGERSPSLPAALTMRRHHMCLFVCVVFVACCINESCALWKPKKQSSHEEKVPSLRSLTALLHRGQAPTVHRTKGVCDREGHCVRLALLVE